MKTKELSPEICHQRIAHSLGVLSGQSTQAVWQTLYQLVRHHVDLEEKNEELRRSQSQLALSPVGFISVSRRGSILEADAAAATLLGADKKTLVKKPISSFILGKDRKLHNAHCKRLFESRESQVWDQQMVRVDGAHFRAHVEAAIISGETRFARSLIVFRDITPLKRVEDILGKSEEILKKNNEHFKKIVNERSSELLTMQEVLQRSSRLSNVGALVAMVSHELRNPLASISMATENIRRKARNPDIESHLGNIEKKVAESDQIINNLLFYSRCKAPECNRVNIYHIIEECIDQAMSCSSNNVAYERALEHIKGVEVEADAVQMKELFHNLLNNARDALPAGGGRIEIGAALHDWLIKIWVSDDGRGMTESDLKKVFLPFYTTKSNGTGLGLAICDQVIKNHGGSIEIKTKPGSGTTIFVSLPVWSGVQYEK